MGDDAVRTPRRKDREEQRARQVTGRPARIVEIRRGLPDGFRMEVLTDGYALKLTGPRDFLLVYYPGQDRVQYRGQWRTMRASTVVKLMAEVARSAPRSE